ncbi:MAG: glutathione S-transferase [Alphaproteobacteria bacterium]|nr:glutathione S-transferase [Alphaproteobacteria bacterium]
MKFYDSIGPNPRTVRMFAHEKGINLPTEKVDLMKGENRKEPYLKLNAFGQTPALELDNGSFLSEITAICEYLDETNPNDTLIGKTPEQRAETRMWTRRVDLNIVEPLTNGFRFAEGLGLFKDRIPTFPEAAPGLKKIAQHNLAWLDKQMEGKQFIAGSRLTLADVLLFCFLDFAGGVGQPIPAELKNVTAWNDRMKARPSAVATAG